MYGYGCGFGYPAYGGGLSWLWIIIVIFIIFCLFCNNGFGNRNWC